MNLTNTGLILEGGGMRGVYTSGVLDFFMDKELYFPYVIGVSMGACNAANYISRQRGRNKIVNIEYVNDLRYLSYYRLITKGELFGMDFIFKTIPDELDLFDYKTFRENKARCITVVTDCMTGEALYYEKNDLGDDFLKILQASSSLPFISQPVKYKDRILMDGGMSDSIPLRKSISDGNTKNVIILTQPEGYRKKPEPFARFAKLRYPKYKGLAEAFKLRHTGYNETIEFIEELSEKGNAFVIRPETALSVGRIETNKQKLYTLYDRGYRDAEGKYDALCSFFKVNE